MQPSNSSTSNFDPLPRRELADAIKVVIGTIGFLLVLDVAINFLFEMPSSPRVKPSTLQQYFNYGRSIESKLTYMVRETDDQSAPISTSGWLSEVVDLPEMPASPNGRLFAVYGQSMSGRVGLQIASLDSSVTVRTRGGPGAPLGHTFELYRRDRVQHQADVVVLGIVASGIMSLTTMTTMGTAWEVPAPYTFPKWELRDGELTSIQPIINSLDELRVALRNPALWREFCLQLEAHDPSYSSWMFNKSFTDHSAILRIAKRGLGQHQQSEMASRFQTGAVRAQVIALAREIVRQFGKEVRDHGAIPVVLLFHDRGTGDELYQTLSGVLLSEDIPFVSTHEIAPANISSSFLSDGHFIRKFDTVIAQRVLDLVAVNAGSD